MKCPKCQFDNPEDINFCGKCGAKLEGICPNCNFSNPPEFSFCGKCGQNLITPPGPTSKELSFDEKLAKIQRYLPKDLTQKTLAQRDKIEGERKQVTVMFCDMEGFTSLTEKVGPEETYSIMDEVYEILIHKVHDYEGTVNELTGDGIMALFGAPIALEDAPERAIRSSLAIHREMAIFSDKIREEKEGIPPLKMRIGIHTGPVVVGTLGNDLRVEFKAVGDTVNLASRMEGLSEPGTTYVTGETFSLSEGLFRFEALGEKEVKGKQEPLSVYRVIAPSTRRSRFDVSAEHGLTPFVGRDRELELLMDGFERCKEARGQAFSIVSEAGVGKSRLLYEFRKAVVNENVTFLEGKCLSYSRNVAYHPVTDILKSNFDIREGDGDLEIRKKVQKGLEVLKADEASTLSCLLELFSVKDSGIEQMPMSPEIRRKRIIEALTRIVLKGSEIRPLIMAIEDLHWIDTSSEQSLKHLLESISGTRVLLIFTYRPEFVHTWGGRSYHSQLNLNRLSNRESLIMVFHLLGTNQLDRNLEAILLEKTEGVPFFIEEFIKSLKNLKIIERRESKYHLVKDVQNLTIPTTIQDVIMARVDSLPEKAKEVLQRGSVIEREFSYDLLQRVVEMPEQELLSYLSVLKDFELLYERGIYPESTYIFKHALTREVVYDSILTKRKKGLHEKIAKAIEAIYSERLEEFSEILAHHSFQGEDWERAQKYNGRAGLKALSFSAYEEAQGYFEKALQSLGKLSRTRDRILQEIDLRFYMRAALFPLGRHEEWVEYMRAAEPLAKEVGDNVRLASCYNYLSTHLWTLGQHKEAIRLCEEALGLAESASDFSVYISTMFHLGVALFFTGQYERQVKLHREVAGRLSGPAVFERHGLAGLPSVLARSILSLGLAELGEFEEAEERGLQGVEIAEQGNNLFSTTWAYACVGAAYLRQGKLVRATKMLEKALALCREAEVLSAFSFTAGNLGHAQSLLGHPDDALPIAGEAVRPQKVSFSIIPSAYPLTALAEAYRLKGNTKKAIQNAEEALSIFRQNGERGFGAWALYYMAKIQSDGGPEQIDQTLQSYRQAKDQATELGMRPLLAHCHMGLGEAYVKTGLSEKARPELLAAIELYRCMDMAFWLPKAESALASIK
jgi:class 3 adenylate cyclase/tetratricopeptide (TPR) repeat protein/ribosomal protein L40E